LRGRYLGSRRQWVNTATPHGVEWKRDSSLAARRSRADISAVDGSGLTLLLQVAMNWNEAVAQLLINRRADVLAVDSSSVGAPREWALCEILQWEEEGKTQPKRVVFRKKQGRNVERKY